MIAERRPLAGALLFGSVVIAWLLFFLDLPILAVAWSTAANEGVTGRVAASASWWGVIGLQAILALIACLACWFLGPRWLLLRIRWAGGNCDLLTARWAYWIVAMPVIAIGLLAILFLLLTFPSPSDPALADAAGLRILWPIVLTALLIGSCWHLWLMATRGLGARPIAAGVLLVALPGCWYLLNMLLLLSIGSPTLTQLARGVQRGIEEIAEQREVMHAWARAQVEEEELAPWRAPVRSAGESAGVTRPAASAFDGHAFEPTARVPIHFRYPSVWRVEIDPQPLFACDAAVVVHPHGWSVRLHVHPPVDWSGSPMEALDQIAQSIRVRDPDLRLVGPVTKLGARSGLGREYRWTLDGMQVRTILFIPERPGSHPMTLVEALLPERSEFDERRGVDAIVETLTIDERVRFE